MNKTKETHRKYYYIPILEALIELGGRADVTTIGERLERSMRRSGILSRPDYESKPRGQVIWLNQAYFARLDMIRNGLLRPNSPKMIWEVTQRGRTAYTKACSIDKALDRAHALYDYYEVQAKDIFKVLEDYGVQDPSCANAIIGEFIDDVDFFMSNEFLPGIGSQNPDKQIA